jgi:hypothetical protein
MNDVPQSKENLGGKGVLAIARGLSPEASVQQLQAQFETAMQNLKQEADNAQLAAEQSAELNSQPEQASKPTMRNVADVTRGIVNFLKLGADANEAGLLNSIAIKLDRVQGNSFSDHGLVERAISELNELAKNSSGLDARAQQAFETQDQISKAKMYGSISDLLVQQPWAKEIVRKAIGEEVVNGPKKEAEKKTETNTANNDTTTNSSSPSRGMSPRAGA